MYGLDWEDTKESWDGWGGATDGCHKATPPQTNADRIRAMSDDNLAWELMTWRIETCFKLRGHQSDYPDTQAKILDWLKQPVASGGLHETSKHLQV